MTYSGCSHCHADLSPWEGSACLTCEHPDVSVTGMSLADAAVRVLEFEKRPITVYDIGRIILRDVGLKTVRGTLQAALSRDPRFCWAGKGLYGLYRHNLVPGPRNLTGVSRLFLFAYGGPVEVERLAFAMKYMGYRFQEQSLRIVLTQADSVRWPAASHCRVPTDEEAKEVLYDLGFAPSLATFDVILDRSQGLLREGLTEYGRRLRTE